MVDGAQPYGADRLGYSIKRAEQALVARKTGALREFDLTVAQYGVLALLSRSDGMSAAQLARACLVTPQTMATVLTNLEGKGLIERHASELHQKVLVTTVTPAGRVLADKADQVAVAIEDGLAEQFSADELVILRALLDRVVKALND